MMASATYRRRLCLTVGVVLCGIVVTMLASGQQQGTDTGTTVDWALFVLDHERWYQDQAYWSANGWGQAELPELGAGAIADRELSALLALLASNPKENEREEYLTKYLSHHNEIVGRAALSKLIAFETWTTTQAVKYAKRRGWDVAEYQEHASQMESKRTESSATRERTSMTPEQWREYQVRDKVADAIGILDHANWHESDPWIQSIRESHDRNPPDKRTPLDGNIRRREVIAIGTIINSEMPTEQKGMLLAKYLEHHNEAVSSRCFVALVTSTRMSPERAIPFVEEHNPTAGGWHMLLSSLPNDTPQSVRQDVARRLLGAARENPSVYSTGSPPASEIDAARLLLASDDERDHALIRWSVQQYPDSTMLWAAVSRLPTDERTDRLARTTYGDATNPLAVRYAAALVFAKSDADIMGDVVNHILSGDREFGSKEFLDWHSEWWSRPADPSRKAHFLRAKEMVGLLPVAYEMPVKFLGAHVAECVDYPYMTMGAGMCMILARRLPREFVVAVSNLDSVPRELYGPLVIAGQYDLEVADDATRLLPTGEQRRVGDPAIESGAVNERPR